MVWFEMMPKGAEVGQVTTGAKMANIYGTCADRNGHNILFLHVFANRGLHSLAMWARAVKSTIGPAF